jgi:hypothetical protein
MNPHRIPAPGATSRSNLFLLLPLCAALSAPASAQQSDAAPAAAPFLGSYTALLESWDADVALPSPTQATMPPPSPPQKKRGGWELEFSAISDEVTLHSVDGYLDDWYSSSGDKVFDWRNVDRTRYGGRFMAGDDTLRFGLEVFTERFDSTDHFSGTGGDFLLFGTPTIAGNRDWSWFLDTSLRFGWVRDHGDVNFVTRFGNTIADHATLDYEFAQLDLGTGLRFSGVEVAVGMRLDDMLGYLDLDNGAYFYTDGTNLAFYTRVGYQPPSLPVFANATWFVGDVRGLGFVLGVRF